MDFQSIVFKYFTQGLKTNRDSWVISNEKQDLSTKIKYFEKVYSASLKSGIMNTEIQWTRKLNRLLDQKEKLVIESESYLKYVFRPFTKKWVYYSNQLNEDLYQIDIVFNPKSGSIQNVIGISGVPNSSDFHLLGTNELPDYHFLSDPQFLPLYRYASDGTREDNITDWGLAQFREHYASVIPRSKERTTKESPDNKGIASAEPRNDAQKEITKEDIFHYTYGVLHNPAYREKYALNLKREFPRLPFYEDFWQWAKWGKQLMDLHIGYEEVEPYDLQRTDLPGFIPGSSKKEPKVPAQGREPRPKLKADKEAGTILLDEQTSLHGIPPEAWEYKLGNRTALEWILDQYKEKKPRDATIAEKFNTYRFADYKEQVIDLLKRVCTVSVETVKIVEEMKKIDKAR